MLLSCQVRIDARGFTPPMRGDALLALAKEELGIYGGISHSIGQREDMAFVQFDPETARGGIPAIFEFAAAMAEAEGFTWEVRFHGLED